MCRGQSGCGVLEVIAILVLWGLWQFGILPLWTPIASTSIWAIIFTIRSVADMTDLYIHR